MTLLIRAMERVHVCVFSRKQEKTPFLARHGREGECCG